MWNHGKVPTSGLHGFDNLCLHRWRFPRIHVQFIRDVFSLLDRSGMRRACVLAVNAGWITVFRHMTPNCVWNVGFVLWCCGSAVVGDLYTEGADGKAAARGPIQRQQTACRVSTRTAEQWISAILFCTSISGYRHPRRRITVPVQQQLCWRAWDPCNLWHRMRRIVSLGGSVTVICCNVNK